MKVGWFAMILLMTLVLSARGASVRIAVFGDFGSGDAAAASVADMVKNQLQPDFIVTTGDNNYGTASQYDSVVGRFYSDYLGNYRGTFGSGAVSNRFFPAIGNHDWYTTGGYQSYLEYFSLPGNERYYDFVRGPVHCFVLNSDQHEPDGHAAHSAQGLWLSNALAVSTARWKLVFTHYPPYSSSGSFPEARWPYHEWGADAVFAGHSHNYERIFRNEIVYFVSGLGGAARHGVGETPVSGSQVRYNKDEGSMLVVASQDDILYQFHSVTDGGTLIDEYRVSLPRLRVEQDVEQVRLMWADHGADDYRLEECTRWEGEQTWEPIPEVSTVANGLYTVITTNIGPMRFFRLQVAPLRPALEQ